MPQNLFIFRRHESPPRLLAGIPKAFRLGYDKCCLCRHDSAMTYLPLATHNRLQNGNLLDTMHIGSELLWQNRCESDKPSGQIDAQFNGINLGPISIVYLSFGADVSIEPLCHEQHLIVQTTLSGHGSTRNGRRLVTTRPNDVAVIDAALPTRISFTQGCAHLVLKIDRSLIETQLAALLQREVTQPVVFDLLSGRNDASRGAWLETMNFFCAFYDKPERQTLQSRHLLQSHINMAVCTLLSSQQHNFSALLDDERHASAPRHVRRACEYIDSHIKEAIAMSDLCRISNVTERTLQNGFKKYLGQTPSAFIQARRVHHLHLALQNASGQTNVSRIMWEHGITNPGRWAQLYFKCYGCYPSATLSKSVK